MTSIVSPVPRLFELEVGRNAINGIVSSGFIGSNPNIGKSFETVWDAGGDFIYPTAGEAWEIVSSSANDALGGIGAEKVLIRGLNDAFVEISEIVDMNGTTPILTTITDWFRIYGIIVILSGSSQFNEGTITLRVSGGGDIRSQIQPTMSTSFSGLFTVPASKTLFILSAQTFVPKGEDITVRNRIIIFGTNTSIAGGDAEVYQSSGRVDFKVLPRFPEKADVELRAISTNLSVKVTINIEANLVNTAGLSLFMGGF